MASRCAPTTGLFLPFLYPSLFRKTSRIRFTNYTTATATAAIHTDAKYKHEHEHDSGNTRTDAHPVHQEIPVSRLNPTPDDYAISTFADKAEVTVHAGGGGQGCVSFLRELFIAEGPANGGDGGHGGNVYVQAVRGETSLHKLARRRFLRAGHGKTGQGGNRGGARGDDLVIQVPVGTVVREISRVDPVVDEAAHYRRARDRQREYKRLVQEAESATEVVENGDSDSDAPAKIQTPLPEPPEHPDLHKFVLYPGLTTSDRRNLALPRIPRRERLFVQPEAPIHLDLSAPTVRPILLAAGGVGGLGNPHFVSKELPRPLFATRGERAVSMRLEFELKLLADVGLVGLPNAGKSTLLRALTNSRARVGSWAFTTLQPNIGTVVLDNNKGRPVIPRKKKPSSSSSPYPHPHHHPHAIINDATGMMSLPRLGSVVVSATHPDQRGLEFEGGVNAAAHQDPADEPRTRFTVADIPGLIEGAHLDRGLGIAFLRHVERAGVLAFVVDLGAGDAAEALRALWAEVGLYARMREEEERGREAAGRIDWEGDGTGPAPPPPPPPQQHSYGGVVLSGDHHTMSSSSATQTSTPGLDIAAKPWFVVATKGDLPGAQENYARLKKYLDDVTAGREPHPGAVAVGAEGEGEGAPPWTEDCAAIPISAIHGQGVDRVVHWAAGLLDGCWREEV